VKVQLERERFSSVHQVEAIDLPESSPRPDHKAIARLAYEYWEERQQNNISGSAEDDWYRAEKHLGI
jgi:Protein of unknown function (DUF2934)